MQVAQLRQAGGQHPRDYHRGRFAETLQALRRAAAPPLTQEALATASGLSYRKIVDLERGKAAVELDVIKALGDVFGLPPLLQSILPESAGEPSAFRDQLMESITRASLGRKLAGLSRDETINFVMTVSQLPADDIRVLLKFVVVARPCVSDADRANA